MSLTIRVDTDIYFEAVNYTINSSNYTHDYDSQWGDIKNETVKIFKKTERILNGQLAERTLARFFKDQDWDIKTDQTDFHKVDKTDFFLNGFSIDVKSTTTDWPLQITSEKSRSSTDYFCFCRVAPNLKWVKFCGFVSTMDAMDEKYLVRKGEEIPQSKGAIQKFGESYFYTGKFIGLSGFLKLKK